MIGRLRSVCAWCEAEKPPAERIPDRGDLTHGICPRHHLEMVMPVRERKADRAQIALLETYLTERKGGAAR